MSAVCKQNMYQQITVCVISILQDHKQTLTMIDSPA